MELLSIFYKISYRIFIKIVIEIDILNIKSTICYKRSYLVCNQSKLVTYVSKMNMDILNSISANECGTNVMWNKCSISNIIYL